MFYIQMFYKQNENRNIDVKVRGQAPVQCVCSRLVRECNNFVQYIKVDLNFCIVLLVSLWITLSGKSDFKVPLFDVHSVVFVDTRVSSMRNHINKSV